MLGAMGVGKIPPSTLHPKAGTMSQKKTLTPDELETFLAAHPTWTLDAGMLVCAVEFPDFVAAMAFVNRVAALAEQANHHPDIDIRYNRVRLALISHDAGGITARDAAMAEKLGAEFPATAAN